MEVNEFEDKLYEYLSNNIVCLTQDYKFNIIELKTKAKFFSRLAQK